MTDERARLERKEWIKYGLTSGVGAPVLGITPVALLASLPLDAHITDVLTIVVYVVAVVVWAAAVATGSGSSYGGTLSSLGGGSWRAQ